MTRVVVLRLGYGAIGAAFLSLAGSSYVGALLPLALVLAFFGGLLLAFSDDDLPKWAGLALVAYFLVSVLAFLASAPFTIRAGGRFAIDDPVLSEDLAYYVYVLAPLMLAGAALAAAWERERPARFLLVGGLAGFALVALLTFLLPVTDPARASTQGDLLLVLFSLCALAGAVGALWSAARPEEYA